MFERVQKRQNMLTHLKDHEEDAKETGHYRFSRLAGKSRVPFAESHHVRADRRPERSGAQPDEHRCGNQRRPDGVAVRRCVDDEPDAGGSHRPSMSESGDDDWRQEGARKDQRTVEGARRDDVQAGRRRLATKVAPKAAEPAEGDEDKQEGDADEDEVLDDAALLDPGAGRRDRMRIAGNAADTGRAVGGGQRQHPRVGLLRWGVDVVSGRFSSDSKMVAPLLHWF